MESRIYVTPEIEVLNVYIENGFASSEETQSAWIDDWVEEDF